MRDASRGGFLSGLRIRKNCNLNSRRTPDASSSPAHRSARFPAFQDRPTAAANGLPKGAAEAFRHEWTDRLG
jgi:hypothetical protein